MTEEQLLSRDRQKVAQFLSLAESGTVQAGLTPKQQQQQREYIMRQRDIYANAAFRAQDKLIPKTSPAYLENIQEMNQVKSNLENLALQQKAIGENQQQYLDDVESGRVSKANYVEGKSNGLADIYSGQANMNIDDFGNITFEVDGEYKPYAQLADYSLKAIDTANGILDMVDKVAGSKTPLSQAQMGIFNNRIKSILDGASKADVISLVKDDLLPGFENIDIDSELFKTEKLADLKTQVQNIITTAAKDINSSIVPPQRGGGRKSKKSSVTSTSEEEVVYGFDEDSKKYYKRVMLPDGSYNLSIVPAEEAVAANPDLIGQSTIYLTDEELSGLNTDFVGPQEAEQVETPEYPLGIGL